jgi:hypothetical protein
MYGVFTGLPAGRHRQDQQQQQQRQKDTPDMSDRASFFLATYSVFTGLPEGMESTVAGKKSSRRTYQTSSADTARAACS